MSLDDSELALQSYESNGNERLVLLPNLPRSLGCAEQIGIEPMHRCK